MVEGSQATGVGHTAVTEVSRIRQLCVVKVEVRIQEQRRRVQESYRKGLQMGAIDGKPHSIKLMILKNADGQSQLQINVEIRADFQRILQTKSRR